MADNVKNNELIQKPEIHDDYDEDSELGGSMTFLEHLGELRERLIHALLAFTVATVICFMFSEHIYNVLIWPLPDYLKMDYQQQLQMLADQKKEMQNSSENAAIGSATAAISQATAVIDSVTNTTTDTTGEIINTRRGNLVVLTVFEGVLVYVKISVIAGIFLAFPIIFYEAWLFIAPGLYKREKKLVLPLVLSAWFCFILGGLFCYFVIYGFILVYMADVFTPPGVEIQWSLSNYVSTTTNFLLAFGLVFEEPVLFALLAKIGIVTAEGLSKFRAYAVVIIFTVAALITPPDPFSQTACAIPMWILYEISILIVKSIERGRKDERGESYAG